METKGYFMTFWLFLWHNIIKHSVTYKLLCKLYGFISRQWLTSRFTNLFRKTYFSDDTVNSSIWGKICFSPFRLVESICKKHREKLVDLKERSGIVRIFNYLLHNLLALNLRFLGILIAAASLTLFGGAIAGGNGFIIPAAGSVIGIILYFIDVNLTELLSESVLVKFCQTALDEDFRFDFFYLTKCGGKGRLIWAGILGIIAGMVGVVLSPIFSVLFIGGLFFFALVLYKVEFGVYTTIFFAPILPTMAVLGLSLLCLFSLMLRALTTKKFTFRTEGIGLLIIIMMAVYLFATITSFAPIKSAQILAVYVFFMLFYFVIINTIKTKRQLFIILKVFALSALAVCLYGIAQYLFGWNVHQAWMDEQMFDDIKMRIYSTLENPNVLGEYILLALPVAVALIWTSKKTFSKFVFAGISAVLAVALILTFSRGCWLGFMASAAIFVTFTAGKIWGLALVALPIIPMILPESIINRFTSIGDMGDSSTSYRVYIWLGTLLMLKDFWISGVGLGTEAFTQVYPFYSYNAIVAPHPHNLFLQVLTETGVLGIFTFLLLLFIFFKKLIGGFQYMGKGHPLSIVIVAMGSAVAGFLLQGMFDNCFYNYRVFAIFWSFLAIGIACCQIAKNESREMEAKQND